MPGFMHPLVNKLNGPPNKAPTVDKNKIFIINTGKA